MAKALVLSEIEHYATQEEAELALRSWKLHLPFREWCAVEIDSIWYIRDSRRKCLNLARKAGCRSVQLLEF